MALKLSTSEAALFCTANGRRISLRTLQKMRTRAPGDPGEKGPRFLRDPVTLHAHYLEPDLRAWIDELDRRLVERAPAPQPKQLAAAA